MEAIAFVYNRDTSFDGTDATSNVTTTLADKVLFLGDILDKFVSFLNMAGYDVDEVIAVTETGSVVSSADGDEFVSFDA